MERINNSSIPDHFHIYYSKRKISFVVLRGPFFIAFLAMIVRANLSDWPLEAPLARIPSVELWFLLLFVVSLLSWFVYRPLRQLSKLATPVVTMSQEGIALRGSPPMSWRTIKRSYFPSFGYGGLAVYAVIWIKTSSAILPKAILSDTLGISREEYQRQSRHYAKLSHA
jgi:hypothetical protein